MNQPKTLKDIEKDKNFIPRHQLRKEAIKSMKANNRGEGPMTVHSWILWFFNIEEGKHD